MRQRVLFLCTANSARSIIAAALLERRAGGGFDVQSAGVEPSSVNPYALRVLEDAGIDASAARSKDVTEFAGQAFDFVITVCDDAAERLPGLPRPRTPPALVPSRPRGNHRR